MQITTNIPDYFNVKHYKQFSVLKSLDELEEVAEYAVRILDFVIDMQDYPVAAARKMLKRRSIGVGVTNFAYWLAKNNLLDTIQNPSKYFSLLP